eukprot:XP_011665175.1 PREDICTED: PERQ amino acid-rich with GYF domain-containing protein 2-like [Strongylocentrotus purpuratus]
MNQSTKSLREIQEEQARQQMERGKAKQTEQSKGMTFSSAAVWGSGGANTSLAWSGDHASGGGGGGGGSSSTSSVWGDQPRTVSSSSANMGFWDECARDNVRDTVSKPK